MVRLRVSVRCISEDDYLKSFDLNRPSHAPVSGERKFMLLVNDPEDWHIGRLAVEIGRQYERQYREPLGKVKYIKDNEEDSDIDPEYTVADALVDIGKASQDPSDQRATVKVIREGGHAVREGSVVPDLSRAHYHVSAPPSRPPVPLFPGTSKRSYAETSPSGDLDGAHKRQRIDQLRNGEEEDDIISSIERMDTNEEIQQDQTGPKEESPEIDATWSNAEPATRDELEELPTAPATTTFRQEPRGLATAIARRSKTTEIRESSQPEIPADRQPHPSRIRNPQPAERVRQQDRQSPITPPHSVQAAKSQTYRTGSVAAVQQLNNMSRSPVASHLHTLPRSTSSNRFRKSRGGDTYDQPDSDGIEDTQMSPRSVEKGVERSARKRVRPTSVSHSSITPGPSTSRTNEWRASETSKTPRRDALLQDTRHNRQDSGAGTPEQQDDAQSGADGREEDDDEAANSDEEREPPHHVSKSTTRLPSRRNSISSLTETARGRGPGHNESAIRSGVDSPSQQLLSEAARPSYSATTTARSTAKEKSLEQELVREIERSPESVSDVDETKATQARKTAKKSRTSHVNPNDRRCYTCWVKPSTCDNARPKCGQCAKKKRPANCQIYDLTKDDFEAERERRDVVKKGSKVSKSTKNKMQSQDQRTSVTDPDQVRCFSCWTNSRSCDNANPVCESCARRSRNCQIRMMTSEEFKAERKARKNDEKSRNVGAKTLVKAGKRIAAKSSKNPGAQENSDVEQVSSDKPEDEESVKSNEEDSHQPTPAPASSKNVKENDRSLVTQNETRCYRCWSQGTRCDNKQPCCSACKKRGKGCIRVKMTKAEFVEEALKREQRKERAEVEKEGSSPKVSKNVAQTADVDEQGEKTATESDEAGSEEDLQDDQESGHEENKIPVLSPQNQDPKVNAAPEEPAEEDNDDAEDDQGETSEEEEDEDEAPMSEQKIDTTTQPLTQREQSTASTPAPVLPPGMSQAEFDDIIRRRANFTHEDLEKQKGQTRRLHAASARSSSPAVPRLTKTQSTTRSSSSVAGSQKNERQVASTQLSNQNHTVNTAQTQDTVVPASVKGDTQSSKSDRPSSRTNESDNQSLTARISQPKDSVNGSIRSDPSSKTKQDAPSAQNGTLKPQSVASNGIPSPSTTNRKTAQPLHNRNNPPFRQHSKAVSPANPTPSSLSALRAKLDSRSTRNSTANTPAPGIQPIPVPIQASALAVAKQAAGKKKPKTLFEEDQSEESSDEDESGSDDSSDDDG